MLIVTNFERFPETWTAANGTVGRSAVGRSASDFLRFRDDASAVFLINGDPRLVLDLARKQLLPFRPRRPIIAVDLNLSRPRELRDRVVVKAKQLLFRRVDYFLQLFKDDAAVSALYGMNGRSGFVGFKANIWNMRVDGARPDGEYAICFGRSFRDYDTFFNAMEKVSYPGAIVDPRIASTWEHGSRFTRPLDRLPRNVRIVPHDLTNESQAELLARAKLVVVPILKDAIVAKGISTILNAMVLGKCVIASAGVGVTDLFDREVLSVPPEDPAALASMIERAWTDDDLRRQTAQAGWEYSQEYGGEEEYFKRIVDAVAEQGKARRW